jgi:serine phosphatase RsbU (regulator of sigma subunit)/anti-sigma regulatory factor (Ser/Thr protein kinase)
MAFDPALLNPLRWIRRSSGARRRVYKLEVAAREVELLTIKDFVQRVCDGAGCSPRETANLKLAADEACTNIIRHAYKGVSGGRIQLEMSTGGGEIELKIADTGRSFDFSRVKDPDLNQYVEIGKKGGLGIWLIKKMVDRVQYHTHEGRNELVLVRRVQAPSWFAWRPVGRGGVTVSAKFTAGTVALTLLVIGTLYAVLSQRQKAILVDQLGQNVQAVVRAVAAEAGESVVRKQDLDLNTLLHELTKGGQGEVLEYAFITGEEGRYLAHSDLEKLFKPYVADPHVPRPEPDRVTIGSFPGRGGRVTDYGAAVMYRGRQVGQVHVAVNDGKIERRLEAAQKDLRRMALLTLLVTVIAIYFLSLMVTRPLQKIFEGVRALSTGDISVRIDLDTKDEFGELASIFNDMTNKLQESQKGMVEQERLQKEMQVAQEIQHTLLPAEFPTIDGYEIGAMYRAAKEVGGDYYDFFWVDPTSLGIVVADVSGKGVPGSLVMTMIRTAMRLESRGNKSASDVLGRVNTHVTADMKKGMFVTMFYIILDSRNRVINFSSAGHNPMVLYRGESRQVFFLKPKGFPLGIDLPEDDQFAKNLALQRIQLHKDDMLVIYTDGITEAMNAAKQQFGEDRLVATIKKNAHLTPQAFVERLNRAVMDFTQGAEQNDDITVVAIKEKMKAESVVYRFRRELLDLVDKKGLSVAEACRRLNTSPAMYYRFRKMQEEGGREALKPAARRAGRDIRELSNEEKRAVMAQVKAHPEWGAAAIAEALRRVKGNPMRIDPRLLHEYLKRKGLGKAAARKAFAANDIDTI